MTPRERELIFDALLDLEDGDISACYRTLQSLLDGEHLPRTMRAFCPACGTGFEWPGYLDDHLDRTRCGDKIRPSAEPTIDEHQRIFESWLHAFEPEKAAA